MAKRGVLGSRRLSSAQYQASCKDRDRCFLHSRPPAAA
jgi:hypothetical protein